METARITIFAGNFGSGKTELSINYAIKLAEEYPRVILADLDVVNPYFRSREKDELLQDYSIEVIYPKRLAKADLPVISANINKILQNKDIYGVFDIGGNDDGAIALGSIAKNVENDDYEMNLVVNTSRPYTNNVEGILEMKQKIEAASHLSFDKVVCNINLGEETDISLIENGYPIVKEAARKMNLPIKFVSILEKLLPLPDGFYPQEDVFPLKKFMNPPWSDN